MLIEKRLLLVAAERSLQALVRPRRKRHSVRVGSHTPHHHRMAASYTLLLTLVTLKTAHAFGGLPSETFTNITVHLVPRECLLPNKTPSARS